MNIDQALDRNTVISAIYAMCEIENHNHSTYVKDGVLWASSEPGQFEQVCIVVNGRVHSRQVMLWLGY